MRLKHAKFQLTEKNIWTGQKMSHSFFSRKFTIIFINDEIKLLDNENVTYSLIWQVRANASD